MKYAMTILCAMAFCIAGACLAFTENEKSEKSFSGATISAATLPINMEGKLPLDLQLDLEKKYTKTDTVYTPMEIICVSSSKVNKPKQKRAHTLAYAAAKRQGQSIPAPEPDPPVKNQVCGDREENTPDTIGPPKASIILTVDGEEVFRR